LAPKCHEANGNRPEIARKLCTFGHRSGYWLDWEDDMSTFFFLALFGTFLLGMVAGAFTRRIVD
jgi:hypothetical protein